MDLSQFYDKIGLDGAARALAERTERGNEALFQPPYLDALFSGTRREEGCGSSKRSSARTRTASRPSST